jgi:hypothetical protein
MVQNYRFFIQTFLNFFLSVWQRLFVKNVEIKKKYIIETVAQVPDLDLLPQIKPDPTS